ncbi:NAD(P)-binding domain-containing protein [Rhodococcus opacus]|uniref:Putative oxidoreductase n=1 Tax=Rhodococcus opacus (strain B4) TaxID=632772 RepID=C1B6H3_RHOOB|nr:NAD(P)-binding domain-containing protein [Rhodococcus opacus]BAH51276.1 putative oxidoreductase [Rhodococcus opacus B4]
MADSGVRAVAVLGTGLMGAAIARVLAKSGCVVTVWNRTAEKAKVLAELDGITAADTAADAVAFADVTLVVLLNSAHVEAAFAGVDLAGRTIVNLVTGTPDEMAGLGDLVTSRGGRYLAGAIAGYPQDIGAEKGALVYSGSAEIYNELKGTLVKLGGRSTLVSERLGGAAATIAALGGFAVVAITAYIEAIAFVQSEGVALDKLGDVTDTVLGVVESGIAESARAIQAGDFETDQAALRTYLKAFETFMEAFDSAGSRSVLIGALTKNLADGVAAGYGNKALAALAKLPRELDVQLI